MKVWDITLTCDHRMLVVAPTVDAALVIAKREAGEHGVRLDGIPEEVDLIPGLLAWYPGPFSHDAIMPEVER